MSINYSCICIPARYKSSRLPGKLMYYLGNKSCIQRTIDKCLETGLHIYVLANHETIYNHVVQTFKDNSQVDVILAKQPCKNGTQRICKNLQNIHPKYTTIVNVQADEPFISPKNIKHAIQKHASIKNDNLHFYSTLHEPFKANSDENKVYLKSTASLTVETSLSNRVLTYTRTIIPWDKKGMVDPDYKYKLFTGIYVFNRKLLNGFDLLPDTPLQIREDIEQLKVLEHDYHIYSFPTVEYNEISLNDTNDLQVLCEKYKLQCIPHATAEY